MKIVSHRGNLNGRNPERENHPSYIQAAIDAGYDVEVDVWYVDTQFYLGHDHPQYSVPLSWLKERISMLWCHAKNDDALANMLECGIHCFWHEADKFTLTSKGVPWCYPKNYIRGGITVVFDDAVNGFLPTDIFGVCTDNPINWRTV